MSPATVREQERWLGNAFGLSIDAPGAIPGIAPGRSAAGRSVRWHRLTDAELRRRWVAGDDTTPVVERRCPDGRLFLRVDHDPVAGYRIQAPGYGTHLVASDGSRIDSVISASTRRWQRLFFAQVLPLAAATSGLGLLHASAVELDGAAFAFVARSGTGKSSLAVHLVAEAAGRLVTDDVLALEPLGATVRAHPGPATVSLAPEELDALSPRGRERLARACWGTDDRKLQLDALTAPAPVPLCGLFFLRRDGEATEPVVRREHAFPPARLLGAAFMPHIKAPVRLAAQLAVCVAVARTVPIYSVAIPANGSARETARRVFDFGVEERLWV